MNPQVKIKIVSWTVVLLMIGAVFVSVVAFYYG